VAIPHDWQQTLEIYGIQARSESCIEAGHTLLVFSNRSWFAISAWY
jgi:hypothetical protein